MYAWVAASHYGLPCICMEGHYTLLEFFLFSYVVGGLSVVTEWYPTILCHRFQSEPGLKNGCPIFGVPKLHTCDMVCDLIWKFCDSVWKIVELQSLTTKSTHCVSTADSHAVQFRVSDYLYCSITDCKCITLFLMRKISEQNVSSLKRKLKIWEGMRFEENGIWDLLKWFKSTGYLLNDWRFAHDCS